MAMPDPSWSGFSRPLLSVVVPTKNEAGNIGVLVDGLETAHHDVFFEIIFRDGKGEVQLIVPGALVLPPMSVNAGQGLDVTWSE
jgi:hypothetical protein